MKRINLILAAAALLALPSCRFVKVNSSILENMGEGRKTIEASDTIVAKDTTVGDFNSFSCFLACDVVYTSGDCSVSLSAPDNIIDYINIENKNGQLVVSKDNKISFNKPQKVTLRISCPELESLNVAGAVEFSAPSGISAPQFSADVNGAGDLEINGLKTGKATIKVNGAADIQIDGLDCSLLNMEVNGAGDIVLNGRAGKAEAVINGAGDINATGLDCNDFSAKTHGIGSVKRPK